MASNASEEYQSSVPPNFDNLAVFALSICLVIIEILGVLCNGIILTVYYKYSKLRTATNLFILNLAICNLLQAATQLTLSSPSFFNKNWLYGKPACVAYGYLHQHLITVAVLTLAAIAFDRFCIITKPFRKMKTFTVTKPRARILICITHAYAFVFTLPLLVGWSELTPDKRYKTGCYIRYSDRGDSSLTYAIMSTAFTCILPLILTTSCYVKIYKSVRKSSRRCTMYKGQRNALHKNAGLRKKSLYHTRTARMIAVVMFFLLLTWLPVRLLGLLSAFGVSTPPLAVYIAVFLAKSCVMYNAVVYVFLNRRFRAAFLHLTFVCRQESRLRYTTDATNASVRNLREIFPSVLEINDRPLAANARKSLLSQLSYARAVDGPESSAASGGVSNLDTYLKTRRWSEIPRQIVDHHRKLSFDEGTLSKNDRTFSINSRSFSVGDRTMSVHDRKMLIKDRKLSANGRKPSFEDVRSNGPGKRTCAIFANEGQDVHEKNDARLSAEQVQEGLPVCDNFDTRSESHSEEIVSHLLMRTRQERHEIRQDLNNKESRCAENEQRLHHLNTSGTCNGLTKTGLRHHVGRTGTDRTDINQDLFALKQNSVEVESSAVEYGASNVEECKAADRKFGFAKKGVFNFAFNNPGLFVEDENLDDSKRIGNYAELDVRSLCNRA